MNELHNEANQWIQVDNFQDFISTNFEGQKNAICWHRKLEGDFAEIVDKVHFSGNMIELEEDDLMHLELSEEGQLAREILLNDLRLFREFGAAPILNVIKNYEEDNELSFFATDVYSFHIDRSDVPSDTILCTYYGDSSEIIPNDQAVQKIQIPEIRQKLHELHQGPATEFDTFLKEYFFDLHYDVDPSAKPIQLGNGHIWRLAIDHPTQIVLPCIHRAPKEISQKRRLLLIC
ncbi:MAG: DUF1826 domain-containing protein [Crocinitomicaceae bacterium]|nr:MAG: DUF1826 domain-containing protein [Crocinitomicaceae bacterium]